MLNAFKELEITVNHSLNHARGRIFLSNRQHKSAGCPAKQGPNNNQVFNSSDLKLLKSECPKDHKPEILAIHSPHYETSTLKKVTKRN